MNINKININQSVPTYGIETNAYNVTYEDSNVGEKLTKLNEKIDSLSLGTFYGFFPNSSSLPIDVTTLGYAYVGTDNPFEIWNFNGESWSDSGTSIDKSDVDADEEDITRNADGKLQFKDRGYGNGMGYVILRKNKSFEEQVTEENTIYEVRYDFSLGDKKNYQGDVVVPNNSIILFNGGSLFSGNLVLGNNSRIENGIFDDVTVFVYGNYITIKNCKFTNKNNVSRSTSNMGYIIRAGGEHLTTDVNHLTIDGCYIEDSINIPISIDDFVDGNYKCNYFTCCNCVIKHATAGITLMGRNASRSNIHAEIYNNSIYFIGNNSAPYGFSISIEP